MNFLNVGNGKHGLSLFVPLAKVGSDEERMCWGYASTEAVDSEGEVITLGALEGALPGYMKFANIREMHQLSAVGIATEADLDEKGLYIGAKVVDDTAWIKVKEGVYKGFSIGGRATERNTRNKKEITGLELIEISLVDRPANPEALIDVWRAEKIANEDELMPGEKKHNPEQIFNCGLPGHSHARKDNAIKCMIQQESRFGKSMPTAQKLAHDLGKKISEFNSEELAKASTALENLDTKQPEEVKLEAAEGSIEELTDKYAALDIPKGSSPLDVARMLECSEEQAKAAIGLNIHRTNPSMAKMLGINVEVLRATVMEKKKKPKEEEPEDDNDEEEDDKNYSAADKEPYGDVEYADTGYQKDGKKRYPIDTEAHIRAAWNYINKPKNAAKYSSENVATIKSRIVAAWKKHIDKEGPPSAADGKGNKQEKAMGLDIKKTFGDSDASKSIKKGITTVISALSLLKQINQIRNCLEMEKEKEGDESDQSTRWAEVLKSVGTLVQDLAKEEIDEMLETGKDVDFRYGYGDYDIAWAAKALQPAMLAMSKSDFIDTWNEAVGDDTAAKGYTMLSEFADELDKEGGSLSIEDWTRPGEGTGYGSHSSEANDDWKKMMKSAQDIHDASVSMGATCKADKPKEDDDDKEKTHNDEPGATGGGAPKKPPEDIKEKAKKPNMRGEDDKDPEKPGEAKPDNDGDADDKGKKKKKNKKMKKKADLADLLLARMINQNDALTEALLTKGVSEGRDPPLPGKGKLFVVDKAQDYHAPGDGNTNDSTGEKKSDDPQDVLKAALSTPRFVSR